MIIGKAERSHYSQCSYFLEELGQFSNTMRELHDTFNLLSLYD